MTLRSLPQVSPEPRLSAAEAAAALRVSKVHLFRLVASGHLTAERPLGDAPGKPYAFDPAGVERLRKLRDGEAGDVIDRVDIDAAAKEPNEDRNAMTRAAFLDAIEKVVKRTGGTFHIGQVRPLVDESLSGPAVGALICGLRRRRVIEPTGETAESGNSRQRNATRLVNVYRVTGVLS